MKSNRAALAAVLAVAAVTLAALPGCGDTSSADGGAEATELR